MELRQIIRVLWRRSWVLAACLCASTVIAYTVSTQTVPIYEASTTLLINQAPIDSATVDLNVLRTSESLARTYVTLLYKRPVLEAVIANLKLNTSTAQLAKRIRVTTVRETQLIEVTAEDTDPQRAAAIANEIVRVFSQQNRELQASRYTATKQNLFEELLRVQADIDTTQTRLDELKSATSRDDVTERNRLRITLDQHRSSYTALLKSYEQVRGAAARTVDNLNVVEPAEPAQTPIRPRVILETVLGSVTGVIVGLGLMFLIAALDRSVKSSRDIEELFGAPVLASVPLLKEARTWLPLLNDGRSSIANAFHVLRVNLDFLQIDRPMHTLLVTSSHQGEGKSWTAASLAVVAAKTGRRVILVDSDLRRPALHTMFELGNEQGVTSALQHTDATLDDLLVPTRVENLWLMPSGPLPPNPVDLLGSQRMAALIERLKAHCDLVIFDSPPVLAVADSLVLARNCDAALLVALAGSTSSDSLRKSRDSLVLSGIRVLGTVLNGVVTGPRRYQRDYYQQSAEQLHRRFSWRWLQIRLGR